MTQATLREKVLNLQAQVETLRMALVKKPNFGVDEANWKKLRPEVKRVRKSLYRKRYGKR